MELVYGLAHFAKIQWLGDKDKRKCLATWLEVESLQRNSIPEENRAEMLLDLMKQSTEMQLEVSFYRQRLYQNEGRHDDKALLEIFRRTIVMESGTANDKALLQGLNNQNSTKPVKPVNPVTTPCKYGDACNVAGCQFKHSSPSKGKGKSKGTGKAPSPKDAKNKQPGGKPPGGKPSPKSKANPATPAKGGDK
jgi:hypothetical protein